jgi:hypothetical protein
MSNVSSPRTQQFSYFFFLSFSDILLPAETNRKDKEEKIKMQNTKLDCDRQGYILEKFIGYSVHESGKSFKKCSVQDL